MFSTTLYETASGVRVRSDSIPCQMMTYEGVPCALFKKRLFFEYLDPSKVKRRSATLSCEHQREHGGTFWTEEMLCELFDCINNGMLFKNIDPHMRLKFPDVKFSEPSIHRRPNGEYKEFDCPAKKKYEDVKLNRVSFDVWSHDVLRKDADDAISWSDKTFSRQTKL